MIFTNPLSPGRPALPGIYDNFAVSLASTREGAARRDAGWKRNSRSFIADSRELIRWSVLQDDTASNREVMKRMAA